MILLHADQGAQQFKRVRRVRIAACFACRHRFAKDGWADEQFHVLCKDRQDTHFIRFDESISITGNFREDNCTMLYNNIQTTLPRHRKPLHDIPPRQHAGAELPAVLLRINGVFGAEFEYISCLLPQMDVGIHLRL